MESLFDTFRSRWLVNLFSFFDNNFLWREHTNTLVADVDMERRRCLVFGSDFLAGEFLNCLLGYVS